MNREWQRTMESNRPTAAASLPPAMVEETGWDILLALHSHDVSEPSLEKLAALVSVPPKVMHRWLMRLEERHLIAAAKRDPTGELSAVLTPAGREMLDSYFSAAKGLHFGTHH